MSNAKINFDRYQSDFLEKESIHLLQPKFIFNSMNKKHLHNNFLQFTES